MIKNKSVLSALSLFIVALMLITAYADAATNITTPNASTNKNTDEYNTSNDYGNSNNWTDSALYDNSSSVQGIITGHVNKGIVDKDYNASVEISRGDKYLSWNYTQYTSEKYGDNGFGTLSVLAGPNPMNFTSKVNYTPIVDAVGMEEAQFGDVQHVTIYGIDDASVIETYGYGDCWADACWLYNKLSALGVPVRIMAYQDGGTGDGYRHTWIEINIGNGWETWNYAKYGSPHAGDNGYGTPYVLIEPGHAPADIMKTGY